MDAGEAANNFDAQATLHIDNSRRATRRVGAIRVTLDFGITFKGSLSRSAFNGMTVLRARVMDGTRGAAVWRAALTNPACLAARPALFYFRGSEEALAELAQ